MYSGSIDELLRFAGEHGVSYSDWLMMTPNDLFQYVIGVKRARHKQNHWNAQAAVGSVANVAAMFDKKAKILQVQDLYPFGKNAFLLKD